MSNTNSFNGVQNISEYSDVYASSAQVVSLSVNTFTNGPLTYFNVVGYAPTEFATLNGSDTVILSTTNGLPTASSPILYIPTGACITSIMLTNNGIPIAGPTIVTLTAINSLSPFIYQELNNNADGGASVDIINDIGYCIQQVPTTYIVQNAPVYIQVSVDDTVTAGSVCVYITYVNF